MRSEGVVEVEVNTTSGKPLVGFVDEPYENLNSVERVTINSCQSEKSIELKVSPGGVVTLPL